MYTLPSTAANLPCLPGSSALLHRVLTSLVPPVHYQGVSLAPLQGLALWNIFLPTTGSFFVSFITDFLPSCNSTSQWTFSCCIPVFYTSSYRGWSEHSSILCSNAQTNHDILFPDIFMLPLSFPALRYHSASSDHYNRHLLSVSCRRS